MHSPAKLAPDINIFFDFDVYGLMIKIADHQDAEACMFIEKGWNDVYYGLTMVVDGSKRESQDIRFTALAQGLAEHCDFGQNEYWICRNYCRPKINFGSFSSDNTLKLLNDNYRSEYIDKLWLDIKGFISMTQDAMSTL